MAVCLRCGKENDLDAKFCNFCGKDLTEMPGGRKCPKCGTSNPVHVVFCGTCGADLPPATTQEIAVDREAASRPPPPLSPPPASEPEAIANFPVCQWCKKPVGPYTRVCQYCHRDLITGVVAAPAISKYDDGTYADDYAVESRPESATPTIAGILLILAGLAAFGQGILYLMVQDIASSAGYVGVDVGCCGGIDLLFGIAALVGGVFAIQRSHFVIALLACVCAILSLALLFVGPLLGFIAILLVALSKEEFSEG